MFILKRNSKKKYCDLCGQVLDLFTSSHKTQPFIDGRLYEKMCLTCFFVPKTMVQTYTSKGLVKDETNVPYSCNSLHTPKEIFNQGSSDNLKQAKISVNKIIAACSCGKKLKESARPKPDWRLIE